MPNTKETVGIVGGGLVGSVLSIFLAKRGISSEIYEHRPDIRLGKSAGRSINLAVSTRGLHALREIGLEKEILGEAVPMYGRMIHSVQEEQTFLRYGKDDSECIYSISRAGLNRALLSQAEKTQRVKIHFQQKVTHLDLASGELFLKGETSHSVQHSAILATDGSGSLIRSALMQLPGYEFSQEYLDYGYKELSIPALEDGKFQLEKNALHIWPRGTFMLIALPNYDGSFTCTLFLPLKGEVSFASLNQPADVRKFLATQFPDAYRLIPHGIEEFFANPTGNMVTVKCFPWHYADRVCLLGDAAHAIVPFFGQGMNCGFEDCTVLDELLASQSSPDWKALFSDLSRLRKVHTDAIADMAVENFEEMRSKVGNARFLLEKEVEKILQKNFPQEYVSRYAMVTFSRIPYQMAYQSGLAQNEILSELCRNLERPEDVDLQQARALIHSRLGPLNLPSSPSKGN